MDYLARAEVDACVWMKVATARVVSCCGCRNKASWAWCTLIVPAKSRYPEDDSLRLRSCDDGEHSRCVLCQSCGKKLGFEW